MSLLYKFGLFIHNEQEKTRLYNEEDNGIYCYLMRLQSGTRKNTLFSAIESSLQPKFIDSKYALKRADNTTNPEYLYNKFKIWGAFGVFYVIPVFLRKYHNFLLELQIKSVFQTIMATALYIPRILLIPYEIIVNLLTYFVARIVNTLVNTAYRLPNNDPVLTRKEAYLQSIDLENIATIRNFDDNAQQKVDVFLKQLSLNFEIFDRNRYIEALLDHQTAMIYDDFDTVAYGVVPPSKSWCNVPQAMGLTCASGYFGEEAMQDFNAKCSI